VLNQRQNLKGNDPTVESKTKHADKSRNLKTQKEKRQTQAPSGLYELFYSLCQLKR